MAVGFLAIELSAAREVFMPAVSGVGSSISAHVAETAAESAGSLGEGTSAAAAERHFPASLQSTRPPPPPPLNLKDQRFLNQRPSPNSPTTPSPTTMAHYQNPENLPPASEPHGEPAIVSYGRVTVPAESKVYYEAARSRMASNSTGQKYLAHLERGPGPKVEVHPYMVGDGKRLMVGDNMLVEKKPHMAMTSVRTSDGKVEPAVYAAFPINVAVATETGGRLSAVTIAAHELGHAAQARITGPREALVMTPPTNPDPAFGQWTNQAEYHIITKIDNPSLPPNEMPRDSHGLAGWFLNKSFTSIEARDPRAETLMAKASPKLTRETAKLIEHGADSFPNSNGDEQGLAALERRTRLAAELEKKLTKILPKERKD
jgi:hypothetical protein